MDIDFLGKVNNEIENLEEIVQLTVSISSAMTDTCARRSISRVIFV